MSRRRASSVEMDERMDAPSNSHQHGDQNDPSFGASGSVYSKLFRKDQRQQVAVADHDQVEGHENGTRNDTTGRPQDAYERDGYADEDAAELDAEDDEDDEEYDPNNASDKEEDDDDDDDDDNDSDLDDEESSMRSLLLPMATYAKRLLFMSDDEDAGDFDDQDAALWASEHEKLAWIARYEAANRAYVDQYGCSIDSSAFPEAKRKLRGERKRERKYALVLLALAAAYFIRLMVGGSSSPVVVDVQVPASTATVTLPATTTTTETKSAVGRPPVWWTEWTQELVVRVVTWPWTTTSQYLESATLVKTTHTRASSAGKMQDKNHHHQQPDDQPRDELQQHQQHDQPQTSQTPAQAAATVKSPMDGDGDDTPMIQEDGGNSAARENAEETVDPPETTNKKKTTSTVTVVMDISPTPSVDDLAGDMAGDRGAASPREEPTRPASVEVVVIETEVIEVETTIEVVEVVAPTDAETTTTEPVVSTDEANNHGVDGATKPEPQEDFQSTEKLDDSKIVEPVAPPAAPLQQCTELFHRVLKAKGDSELAAQAVDACDAAVDAVATTDAEQSDQRIQALVQRGDLQSFLLHFENARSDYEAAFAAAHSPTTRATIDLKLTANRWIEFYKTRQYRELRTECQGVAATTSTSDSVETDSSTDDHDHDHEVRAVASEWLRAFNRETTLLKVLQKTRWWTIDRLKL